MRNENTCPLEAPQNDKRRYNPENALVALAFQIHDDAKLLAGMGGMKTPLWESCLNHLNLMESRIRYAQKQARIEIAKKKRHP